MTTDLETSPLDDKILSMADYLSAEQISAKLGGTLSAAKVRLRLQALLEEQDWVTEAQRESLLIRRLHKVLRDLEDRPGSEWDLDGMKIQLATLKELGNRLDKRAARVDVDVTAYHRNVGRVMGRAVDLALSYMKGALRSEIDPERWDATLQDALMHARSEIEQHQAVEQ